MSVLIITLGCEVGNPSEATQVPELFLSTQKGPRLPNFGILSYFY